MILITEKDKKVIQSVLFDKIDTNIIYIKNTISQNFNNTDTEDSKVNNYINNIIDNILAYRTLTRKDNNKNENTNN